MASQKLILLLVVITAATGLLVGTSASDAFDQVCDTASDQAFCFNDFGSDPSIKDQTLPQLALSAITRIETRGTLAESKIQTLLNQSTSNPRFKYILQTCDTFYKGVLGAITSGTDDVNNKNYRHLSYLAKITADGGTRCEGLFGVPVSDDYPLLAENRDLKNVGDILRVISGLQSRGTGR